jgi:hypothetical protein
VPRVVGVLGLVTAALGALAPLALAAAALVDRVLSTEVQRIIPKPPEVVVLDRQLWEPGQPVAGIYGTPVGRPLRVVLPDRDRLVRPKEEPGLLLLRVDPQRGEDPLQARTVWFIGVRAAAALGLAAALSLVGFLWLRQRHAGRGRD